MPVPNLPVLADDNSALTQKFGKETANYFSGSPLNRLSFLRTDHTFLSSAFSHPSASFLLMNNLAPLVQADAAHLAFVTGADVLQLTGPTPFAKTEEDLIRDFNSEETRPVILFLGVDENNQLPSHRVGITEEFIYKNYKGSPYFAVDITPRGSLEAVAKELIAVVKAKGYSFHDSSPRHMGLHAGQGEEIPLDLTGQRETY
jgi:NAD+ diphosphatase